MKLFIIILFLSSSFAFSQNAGYTEKQETDNSTASSAVLIERAYASKKIDLNKRILYLAYYLYDYSKIPLKYKSNASEKCGTWIAQIIFNNFDKLQPETKQVLKSYGFK